MSMFTITERKTKKDKFLCVYVMTTDQYGTQYCHWVGEVAIDDAAVRRIRRYAKTALKTALQNEGEYNV